MARPKESARPHGRRHDGKGKGLVECCRRSQSKREALDERVNQGKGGCAFVGKRNVVLVPLTRPVGLCFFEDVEHLEQGERFVGQDCLNVEKFDPSGHVSQTDGLGKGEVVLLKQGKELDRWVFKRGQRH